MDVAVISYDNQFFTNYQLEDRMTKLLSHFNIINFPNAENASVMAI